MKRILLLSMHSLMVSVLSFLLDLYLISILNNSETEFDFPPGSFRLSGNLKNILTFHSSNTKTV